MKKTIDTILEELEHNIATGLELDPAHWLSKAFELNSMLYSLNDTLYRLESKLAKEKAEMFSNDPKMTAAKANVFIEAREEFMESKMLRGKRDQVKENIRLAKKMNEQKKFEYDYINNN